MSYVPPYSIIKQKVHMSGTGAKKRVEMSQAEFSELIKLMLRSVAVDSDWYLRKYPDVTEAIKQGAYKSAKHHFVENGYFEGRLPAEMVVDEAWYMKTYEDVAESIKSRSVRSATEHFLNHGYEEGRFPADY